MSSVRDIVPWSGMPSEEYISGISGDQRTKKSADGAKRMKSRGEICKLCP